MPPKLISTSVGSTVNTGFSNQKYYKMIELITEREEDGFIRNILLQLNSSMSEETDRPVSLSGYWQVAAAWVVPCFSMSILVNHSIWQSQISALLSKRLNCFFVDRTWVHMHREGLRASQKVDLYQRRALTVSVGIPYCGKHRWVSVEACCYARICMIIIIRIRIRESPA